MIGAVSARLFTLLLVVGLLSPTAQAHRSYESFLTLQLHPTPRLVWEYASYHILGYFNEGERYFGLMRKGGEAKPALAHFNQIKP